MYVCVMVGDLLGDYRVWKGGAYGLRGVYN